jgi:hypothetical protein
LQNSLLGLHPVFGNLIMVCFQFYAKSSDGDEV